MSRVLDVYLNEELGGQLEQDDTGAMRFRRFLDQTYCGYSMLLSSIS